MIRLVNKDKNYKNYENILSRIDNYLAFHCLYYKDEPVYIAGIYNDPKWNTNLVRIYDRFFTFPKFRDNGLSTTGKTPVVIPRNVDTIGLTQINFAKENNLIPFYSIENKKRIAIKKHTTLLNKILNVKFEVLDDFYFTCGHRTISKNSCWQNISIENNNIEFLNLPKISKETFSSMFDIQVGDYNGRFNI